MRRNESKRNSKVKSVACWFLAHTILISALAVEVSHEEQGMAKRWAAAKFAGTIKAVPAQNHLSLVGERGSIERSAAKDGRYEFSIPGTSADAIVRGRKMLRRIRRTFGGFEQSGIGRQLGEDGLQHYTVI